MVQREKMPKFKKKQKTEVEAGIVVNNPETSFEKREAYTRLKNNILYLLKYLRIRLYYCIYVNASRVFVLECELSLRVRFYFLLYPFGKEGLLALSLFMALVFGTDNHYFTVSFNNFALIAHRFY